MIKLILIILCFVVISGGFVCFCIVKASTPYDKEQDDLEQIKGYAFLYIQTSHILFTDESMQKKGAIKNTAHQIIIYGGNIYE